MYSCIQAIKGGQTNRRKNTGEKDNHNFPILSFEIVPCAENMYI